MQRLLVLSTVAFAAVGVLSFFVLRDALPDDARDVASEILNREIDAEIRIEPTTINPKAITEAKAAEVIAGLLDVLKDLQEAGVLLDDPATLEAATLASIEAITDRDKELNEAIVPALEESVSVSIAANVVDLRSDIADADSLVGLPREVTNELADRLLDGSLKSLVDEGVSPSEAGKDDILPLVEVVVDAEVEKADVQGQVDKQALTDEVAAAIAALEERVIGDVENDINAASQIMEAVDGLDQGDLNLVAGSVADQATESLVPNLNQRILDEGLDPDDPLDQNRIDGLIGEEVAEAVGNSLIFGTQEQRKELEQRLRESAKAGVEEHAPEFAIADELEGLGILGNAWAIGGVLGIGGGAIVAVLAFLLRQFWSPAISVGGVLLPASRTGSPDRITSRMIHNREEAPSMAFKLAYAGPKKAILEGIEFKAKRTVSGGSGRIFRWAIDRLRPYRGPGSHHRWVRAHDAQQVRVSTDQLEFAEFRDLALPMVLNPGDQFFIRAKSPDPSRASSCTQSDDDPDDLCDEVDMIAIRLRGNFIGPYFFKIEYWEDHKFPNREEDGLERDPSI